MASRKGFYMELNFMQDIRVCYVAAPKELQVEFERPKKYGYAKMIMSAHGELRENRGFVPKDIAFLRDWLKSNLECIVDQYVEDSHNG